MYRLVAVAVLVFGCVTPKVAHVQTEPGVYFITAEDSGLMGAGQRWHERAAEICGKPGYRILGSSQSEVPQALGTLVYSRATMEGYVKCNPPEAP